MQRSSIRPDILQPFLESASNALDKGQAQYFTPRAWAEVLSLPLPAHRLHVLDWNCGGGALLAAAANDSTQHRLGCDIDGLTVRGVEFHQADITRLYPLLRDLEFEADLFALNPPWGLFWHREALAGLAESELLAVADSFPVPDGRAGRGQIDSTAASLMLALDRCSKWGEGYLLANATTVRRLFLAEGAPYASLMEHCWAALHCEGKGPFPVPTTVLYFAHSHTAGINWERTVGNLVDARDLLESLACNRYLYRRGCEARDYSFTKDVEVLWKAAGEEFVRRHGPASPRDYHLWLNEEGVIRTSLSLFEQHAVTVEKEEVRALFSLQDKRPLQLVLQRAQRDVLLRYCGEGRPGLWRVCPKLERAVKLAIQDYHAQRAPLHPLPIMQRLGYLDDEDYMTCTRDLPGFVAGQRYALTTATLSVLRSSSRIGLDGTPQVIELAGQELCLFLTDEEGRRRSFMEARLRHGDVTVVAPPKEGVKKAREDRILLGSHTPVDNELEIDHTLEELVAHFLIPEVPDVAALFPERHQHCLNQIQALEEWMNQPHDSSPCHS